MKKVIFLLIPLLAIFIGIQSNLFSNEPDQGHGQQTMHTEHGQDQHVQGDQHEAHEAETGHGESGGHHGSDMAPLLFIIIALIIGAATRHLLRKAPIPYTVSLLIIGLLIGFAAQKGLFDGWTITGNDAAFGGENILKRGITWAGHIDPHLILYIFLPILIFEAAFAMDTHTFKKSFANATILAIPGIILALIITGAMMMGIHHLGLGVPNWTWTIALLFGTVISATDPVAVVALLKELGASKKLGTLIEGESLLNDGTAIVIYLVLIVMVTGSGSGDSSWISPLLDFLKVALGGTLVGGLIGWLTIGWVRRVFNDALVEISVVVVAAFLTFFVAEGILHVSGVLGLVALGLVMAGVGRTRISPEVEHFLHEFWELAAFIANTLIFIIVGVVIAEQAVFSGKVTGMDFIILGIIYIGIHIVRAIVLSIFYPVMKKIGYGLSGKDAKVLWYGALRGAIGLALGLMVASEESIPQDIRDQFLFYTAGIVMLTLLINATTIKYLVKGLGLTKLAPAKAIMLQEANNYLRESSENAIEKIKNDRYMGKANWKTVESYLPQDIIKIDAENLEEEKGSKLAEIRRRILEKEKSSYWAQFKEGHIGASAVMKLNDGINEILDAGGKVSLSDRVDLETEWSTPKLLSKLQSWPLVGFFVRKMFFDRLSVSYDTARGFITAQEEALGLVQNMIVGRDSSSEITDKEMKDLRMMEQEINENRIHGLTFIRNLRNTYPEIYKSIATRQAVRSMLNYEKKTLDRLQKKGRLDAAESHKMLHNIEERMKKLQDSPPTMGMPKQNEILQEISWLKGLDEKVFAKIEKAFQNKIFSVGEKLVKEDTTGNGLYLVVRGKVKIMLQNEVIDILGPGSVVGEMAVLTGMPRTASVVAESPVTALYMSNRNMLQIMKGSEELHKQLWNFACTRFSENLLRKKEPYNKWVQKEFKQWLNKGELLDMSAGNEVDLHDKVGILITGQLERIHHKREVFNSPCVIKDGDKIKSSTAKVFLCNKKL